jgi:hypothetical protein
MRAEDERSATRPAQLKMMQILFEEAGLEFLDPVEGVSGGGVRFKWGVEDALKAAEGASEATQIYGDASFAEEMRA